MSEGFQASAGVLGRRLSLGVRQLLDGKLTPAMRQWPFPADGAYTGSWLSPPTPALRDSGYKCG